MSERFEPRVYPGVCIESRSGVRSSAWLTADPTRAAERWLSIVEAREDRRDLSWRSRSLESTPQLLVREADATCERCETVPSRR